MSPSRKRRRAKQDTGGGGGGIVFDTASQTEDEAASSQSIPQVLTKAVIPTLAVTSLNAADVLELYYLQRPTVLHQFPQIKITKAALGLRYRPSFLNRRPDAAVHISQPLELTLEYGAARADLFHETVPRVDVPDSTVSWDNEAKVFFTERIDRRVYTTANYLASLSGTVLEKFLNSAVELLLDGKRHRSYQPLGVSLVQKDSETGETSTQQILRSSSDVDFVQQLYHVLAELGVDMQPVIFPISSHIRLHTVDGVEKIPTGVAISPSVPAEFYQKLYTCVQSIASANYSAYATATSDDDKDTSNNSTANNHDPNRFLRQPNEAQEEVETKSPLATTKAPTENSTTTKPSASA